ncbi:hypothetical protein [uncultured Methanomethylovorans sp.]|uniref:hypothetical protein n=1 Tax=uncultured Methanomethylovorans sp. TaxID=183759 RepID=UPI002AA63DEC|nr:hypothetical protein [uncultured Methanomethylovorans sp.]
MRSEIKKGGLLIRLNVKSFSYVEFALRFSINDCPYSVGFETVGASSDELIAFNGCKELFSAAVAGYDDVNFEPLNRGRTYE